VTLAQPDVDLLAFERLWWKVLGGKQRAIRERFDLSPTGYYQALNTILDDPAALAHDPLLVNRLRRMRARRQGAARLTASGAPTGQG
jgi:hypothetical protein